MMKLYDASIMMRFGNETGPLHFICFAFAIYLCVCDVLYQQIPKASKKCVDVCDTEENDKEDSSQKNFDQNGNEDRVRLEVVNSKSFQISKKPSKKVRTILQVFRHFPVKNACNQQPQVQHIFETKKSMFLELQNLLEQSFEDGSTIL